MKKLFILLLFAPFWVFAQKVDENTFDKFDSVWQVSSTRCKIAPMSDAFVFVKYTDIRQSKFTGLSKPFLSLYIGFAATGVTSLNSNSKIKVEFVDNTVKSYEYTGKYNILSSGEYGIVYMKVYTDDLSNELLNKPIKAVRITTSNKDYEYTIKDKNKDVFIKSVGVVMNEVKKGIPKS